MTPKQAVAFVKARGVVLESARGPAPSLAEAVAGEPIRGSWWAHPRASDIFLYTRAIRQSADVLVCRLVGGKVTCVHRRLWPALARLAARFHAERLAAIQEVHTSSGKHEVRTTAFADWLADDVRRAAQGLTEEEVAVSPLATAVSLLQTIVSTRQPTGWSLLMIESARHSIKCPLQSIVSPLHSIVSLFHSIVSTLRRVAFPDRTPRVE